MKNSNLARAFVILFVFYGTNLFSQATQTGVGAAGHNAGGAAATYYLGWSGTSTIPLEIRHDGNFQIRSYTNNIQRFVIDGGAAGAPTGGRVAFSNNVPAGFLPQARIHAFQFGAPLNANMFRTDGEDGIDNTWTMFTGASQALATEKLRLWTFGGVAAVRNDVGLRTTLNGSLFFGTNSILRTKLNGTVSYALNGLGSIARDGYLLVGQDDLLTGGTLYGAGRGAFTLLHLNGNNPGGFVQEFGYRDWMQTGVTLTDNDDRAYIGMRQVAGEANDLVVNWSDNASGAFGPDNMVFNFTTGTAPLGTGGAADLAGTDVDGREIMRLTVQNGAVGIGPRFSNAFQPQSTLHVHQENSASSFMQISNQFNGTAAAPPYNAPTAITTNDGVRLGIFGSGNTDQNGIGLLYNQELKPLLFSTNANTNTVTAIATQERMRVMSVGTTTWMPTGIAVPGPTAYATYNPGSISANMTRVSISHNPANPLVRPLSLLHLGYNTSVNQNASIMDGWRPWMDIGTYTSSKFDNMYVGLKEEQLGGTYDAVINWGRNRDSLPNAGPDHLRFIFTGNYTGGTVNPDQADELNGAELGRFYAGRDTTALASGSVVTYGRFGVGDFTAAGLNQEPTHKLDVDGNGRFRLLPDTLYMADSTVQKVVMVDENGVLRWTDAVESELGYACGDTTNITMLTSDRFIPFHDHNIYFEGDGVQGPTFSTNAIGLGYACGSLMPAKFNVFQQDSTPVTLNTIAGSFINNDRVSGSVGVTTITGVDARSEQLQGSNGVNVAGNFRAGRAPLNIAVRATAGAIATSTDSYGGFFQAINITPGRNYGIYTEANNGVTNNYGIFAKAPLSGGTAGPNYAGYFDGDVVRTGNDNFTSDSILKENIDTLGNALSIINQLKPKTFTYKQTSYPSMSLPGGLQYGFIAQDVEIILPELVNNEIHPPKYDSAGTLLYAPVNYKGMEYTQLVPIIVKAMQEQNVTIDSLQEQNNNLDSIVEALNNKNDEQDSIIQDLNDRLTALENCINALNLCEGPSLLPTNNTNGNNTNNTATAVELSDAQSIVLDQNVPNPFAEQTTITYSLNEGVQKAQMLFYNAEGKLINSQELTTRAGKSQLNVFANDLSNGVYTYTLVVDGRIIDTKRMVKNK
ncbi:MAG TPA: tail fiber domain-containing protein [Flavobacteriales bacterium]|nr:tail fiber domain-containing protein [Flavobacteriales bacterium]